MTDLPINASHWGAFRMRLDGGRLIGVDPFEHDPAPGDLIANIPEIVHSDLRVRRPALRRGWLRGDGGAGRGTDSFVDCDWDEASAICAEKLSGVIRDHGNPAVFGGSYGWASAGRVHHARTLLHRFLNAAGGFTGQVTNYSFGAAMAFLPHVVGAEQAMNTPLQPLSTVARDADLLIAFGGLPDRNWQVQSGGFGLHALPAHLAALEASDIEIICISPDRRDIPPGLTAEWIAIRPGTDTALILALLWQLLTTGAEDRAFLDRHTHGFARLEAHVLGRDGTPAKTPDWAAGITGLPPELILRLAQRLTGQRSMLTATWSLQRARNGEQPYWAIVALAAALGGIGLSGQGFGFGYGSMNGIGEAGWRTPLIGPPSGRNANTPIPVARMADMLLQPGGRFRFNGREGTYPDIRMIWWAGGNPFHHHQDLNRLHAAFARPETVIVNEQIWTATARHADIVLPATTTVERNDIGGSSRDPYIIAMQRGLPPQHDARDDYDIFTAIARHLGAAQEAAFTEGRTGDDWVRWSWAQTRAALAARGIAAPGFEDFWRQGWFRMPDPAPPPPPFAPFRTDPDRHPLSTASGLIQLGGDHFRALSFGAMPDHPAWIEAEDDAHPLQLLTPQPRGKLHSQGDFAMPSRSHQRDGIDFVAINPADAAARGIRAGDRVLVHNARGACQAIANVTDEIRPGVVSIPTGGFFMTEAEGDDATNRNPNALTEDIGTSVFGQGCSAQSCRVEVSLPRIKR